MREHSAETETKLAPQRPITREKLPQLDGESVLVKPARSHEKPVTGVRGTIRVLPGEAAAGGARVEIVITYPEMFTQRRHQRVLPLEDADLERLVESPHGGYEFTTDAKLNPME